MFDSKANILSKIPNNDLSLDCIISDQSRTTKKVHEEGCSHILSSLSRKIQTCANLNSSTFQILNQLMRIEMMSFMKTYLSLLLFPCWIQESLPLPFFFLFHVIVFTHGSTELIGIGRRHLGTTKKFVNFKTDVTVFTRKTILVSS